MRARWMLVPLVACLAEIAVAQSPSPRVGLFAGVNQAHISGSAVSDISNHTRGAFGAYVVAPLPGGGEWALQTGGLLSMKGWERDEPGTRDLAVAKLTDLEVPVLLRYDIATRERLGGFVFGGPASRFVPAARWLPRPTRLGGRKQHRARRSNGRRTGRSRSSPLMRVRSRAEAFASASAPSNSS